MSGFKDFADGNVLTAAEVDGYLMRQSIMRFPTTVALTANLGTSSGVREHGMLAWADNGAGGVGCLYMFSEVNDAWVPMESPVQTFVGQGSSGGTPWTNGSSTQFGLWRYSGGMVKWVWSYTLGTGVNLQTGPFAINLPVDAHASLATGAALGHWSFFDASAGTCLNRTATTLGNAGIVAPSDQAGVRQTTAIPTTLAIPDVLGMNLHYLPTDSVRLT